MQATVILLKLTIVLIEPNENIIIFINNVPSLNKFREGAF